MDIFSLKLEPIDFSKHPSFNWYVRRWCIGLMLLGYYSYASLFLIFVISPGLFFPGTASLGVNQGMVFGSNLGSITLISPLIWMITFGFLGSVFFITRTFIRTTQKGDLEKIERKDMALVWYLTRPLQSVLMAIFIYYLFLAGQLTFFNMEGAPADKNQINVYVLSLIAIITGAFTEQAFDKLQSIAGKVFKVEK